MGIGLIYHGAIVQQMSHDRTHGNGNNVIQPHEYKYGIIIKIKMGMNIGFGN